MRNEGGVVHENLIVALELSIGGWHKSLDTAISAISLPTDMAYQHFRGEHVTNKRFAPIATVRIQEQPIVSLCCINVVHACKKRYYVQVQYNPALNTLTYKPCLKILEPL